MTSELAAVRTWMLESFDLIEIRAKMHRHIINKEGQNMPLVLFNHMFDIKNGI